MAAPRLGLLLVASTLVLSACASASTARPSPSMHQALEQAEQDGVSARPTPAAATQQSFGYQAPYMPLVVPPDVRRVWVPTHVNEDGSLVQGHWVFVPVKTWQWFTEQPLSTRGLGVAVPSESTPPPWPAPVQAGKRTIVPWTVDGKPGAAATAPTPAPDPAPAPMPAEIAGQPAAIAAPAAPAPPAR
jgi:hypothetical protein